LEALWIPRVPKALFNKTLWPFWGFLWPNTLNFPFPPGHFGNPGRVFPPNFFWKPLEPKKTNGSGGIPWEGPSGFIQTQRGQGVSKKKQRAPHFFPIPGSPRETFLRGAQQKKVPGWLLFPFLGGFGEKLVPPRVFFPTPKGWGSPRRYFKRGGGKIFPREIHIPCVFWGAHLGGL